MTNITKTNAKLKSVPEDDEKDSLIRNEDIDKICIEIYKEAYSEAKIKHEELLSESEYITATAQKIILLHFALVGWVTTNINYVRLSDHFDSLGQVYSGAVILLIINLWFLIRLQFAKAIPTKGTNPIAMFTKVSDYVDGKFNGEKAFYYKQIVKYTKKILKVGSKNKERQWKLKLVLISSFVLIILCSLLYAMRPTNP